MANHAYVKTRRMMHAKVIAEIIDRLNKERFKEIFTIETSRSAGAFYWLLRMQIDGRPYRLQPFWLHKTKRTFELRHSPGDFCYWVLCLVANEVALHYNGTQSDDGVDETWKGEPNYCPNFWDMVVRLHGFDAALGRYRWAGFSYSQRVTNAVILATALCPAVFAETLKADAARFMKARRKRDKD